MVAVPSIGRAGQPTPQHAAPEAEATRRLYEQYARQIYTYCFHQLRSKEEAEDATQATFLNAFRGLQRGIDPEFESAWLYKIAQNVCLTKQRSSTRRRRVESPGDLDAIQDLLPAHEVESDELINLPQALQEMPEQQRKALLLREWQGLSYKEIAEELDLSQAAVETLLFRARRSLASGLTEVPKNGRAKRVQNGGDAGSLFALIKSLVLTGGAKVAATVATVAATSVVAATPAARHAVENVVTFSPPAQQPKIHQPVKAPAAQHVSKSGTIASAGVQRSVLPHAIVGSDAPRHHRQAHASTKAASVIVAGHAPADAGTATPVATGTAVPTATTPPTDGTTTTPDTPAVQPSTPAVTPSESPTTPTTTTSGGDKGTSTRTSSGSGDVDTKTTKQTPGGGPTLTANGGAVTVVSTATGSTTPPTNGDGNAGGSGTGKKTGVTTPIATTPSITTPISTTPIATTPTPTTPTATTPGPTATTPTVTTPAPKTTPTVTPALTVQPIVGAIKK